MQWRGQKNSAHTPKPVEAPHLASKVFHGLENCSFCPSRNQQTDNAHYLVFDATMAGVRLADKDRHTCVLRRFPVIIWPHIRV